jgi:LysM repeat protein
MTIVRGVDASAWTREIPLQAWESMAQDGIKFFIPQVWGSGGNGTGANPYLAQHVNGALAADIAVLGGYVWPSWKWPEATAWWEEQVGIPMKLVWLDVEAGAGVHLDQIEDLKDLGFIPGIYCSRHSWSSAMGADSHFKDVPLWVAHYYGGGWPTSLAVGDVPYMPDSWEKPVVWQWKGTTTLRDDQYDLNVADEDWIATLPVAQAPVPVPEEEGMSSAEFTELKGLVEAQTGDIRAAKGLASAARNEAAEAKRAIEGHIKRHPTTAPAEPRPGTKFHTVQSGDTASGIAADNNISLDQLKRWNPGKPRSGNWNLIHPGETFRVG